MMAEGTEVTKDLLHFGTVSRIRFSRPFTPYGVQLVRPDIAPWFRLGDEGLAPFAGILWVVTRRMAVLVFGELDDVNLIHFLKFVAVSESQSWMR